MDDFETLLDRYKGAAERFVKFRLAEPADANDILQEVYLAAFQKFDTLKNKESFRPWLISIARNKCSDYFRKRAKMLEIPLETLDEKKLSYGRQGVTEVLTVRETLEALGDKEKQILYLFYFRELPQEEIARRLKIPLGTVKSRLFAAKAKFKAKYPYKPVSEEGEFSMKKLPEFMPEYQITPSAKEPFSVKWEELMGWFLIPKLGEKLSWAMYDMPSRKCDQIYEMQVNGRAQVHGVEGVEITAKGTSYSQTDHPVRFRTLVAQLTETHCRFLATVFADQGIQKYVTFLDEDDFLPNWGFGENNCGNETNLKKKGDIVRSGNEIKSANKPFLLDIVGRFDVTICGKTYDTVCVMDLETYNNGIASEQFLDQNGRTILWRRFNRDDWAIDRYKKKWSEQLPRNERLFINGKTFVHWYDCITDYIL